MSTNFDGVNGTALFANLGPLLSAGTVNRAGLAMAALWRPLAVEAGGLFRDGGFVASVNPYSDGILYFQVVGGTFVFTTQGEGNGGPGSLYTASDGWRLDAFTMHDEGGGSVAIRHHTQFRNTGTWTHARLSGGSVFAGTASFSGSARFGSNVDSESGQQNIAAIAVWATGGSMSDTAVESMAPGLYAWGTLAPTALWSFENAVDQTIDPLGLGIEKTSLVGGITHVTDEPSGWTYSLTPPAQVLSARIGGALVDTALSGVVRVAGSAVPFGP